MVLSGFISSQAWDSVLDAFHVLSGFWFLITMKLGLKDLAAIVLVPQVVLAAAQCPDYTSFSQVTGNLFFSVLQSTVDSRLRSRMDPHLQGHLVCLICDLSRRVALLTALRSKYVSLLVPITCSSFTWPHQKVIADMKSLIRDPDVARLFENTFPNTLGRFMIPFTI